MTTDVFPSREYWVSLDVRIRKVIGQESGPKRARGLAGWSTQELSLALQLTQERPSAPPLSRRGLVLWYRRRAPITTAFLTLLAAFSRTISINVFREIGVDSGIGEIPVSKRGIALKLFEKDRELLLAVQTRAMVGSVQVTSSFEASKSIVKTKLLTKDFQAELVKSLAEALGESEENIRLDLPHTSAREDEVVYGLVYRGPMVWRKDWRGPHEDYPPLKAVLRFFPKSGFLEIYSRKKSAVEPIVAALGRLVLGDSNGYHALAGDQAASSPGGNVPDSRVEITNQHLQVLKAENLPIAGTPDIELRANDLAGAITQLSSLGVFEPEREVARGVRVAYTFDGVGSETSVYWDRANGKVEYRPFPPAAVRRAILDLIRLKKLGGVG